MSYIRAEKILPLEIVELIQEYIDGENIYIPKKEGNRQQWGGNTQTRQELKKRNEQIYYDSLQGQSVFMLSEKYYLSPKSIQRILCNMKKENECR
jgi:Mor family transcriptional regulator